MTAKDLKLYIFATSASIIRCQRYDRKNHIALPEPASYNILYQDHESFLPLRHFRHAAVPARQPGPNGNHRAHRPPDARPHPTGDRRGRLLVAQNKTLVPESQDVASAGHLPQDSALKTPTGFELSAQGCEERATLGKVPKTSTLNSRQAGHTRGTRERRPGRERV